jgi:L-asparaginase
VELTSLIEEKYNDYDGFVILHGTDTMAYSASVLSFMLEGLTKPVIFTGSQLPIGTPRTDGKENLISSVEIAAAKDAEGHALVPEVCICFDNLLMRGNRTSKLNSDNFRAFRSENYPPLAEAGISIRYNSQLIRKPSSWEDKPLFHKSLDTRVAILKIHPGITPQVVKDILCSKDTRAVIIETYGAGNAPSKEWFINIITQAAEEGKIIMNVTQCLAGSVNMDIYATGKSLKEAGVTSGYDSTTESALGKLFYLLGRFDDNETVAQLLNNELRGEISK